VLRAVHYHQFDTYFFFDDPAQGPAALPRGRVPERGRHGGERAGAAHAHRAVARGGVRVGAPVRSRFFAPATHSPRFYREYFKPARERNVEKDRRRWLVAYRGVQVYVHVDRLLNPQADGCFVEVKSRTWSRRDAQDKSAIVTELLNRFGARPDDTIEEGYVEWSGVS
jgi:5-methylthioadenosine/S-adenosylhomocysteine deaminase